jgi:putative membrane protein insertion efficiency factor
MTWFIVTVIRGYQRCTHGWMPPICRFHPSCSRYAVRAVQLWGPWRGGWMGVMRILRCHPFHPGGIDEVPLPPGMIEGTKP